LLRPTGNNSINIRALKIDVVLNGLQLKKETGSVLFIVAFYVIATLNNQFSYNRLFFRDSEGK